MPVYDNNYIKLYKKIFAYHISGVIGFGEDDSYSKSIYCFIGFFLM